MLASELFHDGFFKLGVRILLDTFVAAYKCLLCIIGCYAHDIKQVFKKASQQFIEHKVTAIKTAKNCNPDFMGTHGLCFTKMNDAVSTKKRMAISTQLKPVLTI